MPDRTAASTARRHRVWILNHYAVAPDRPGGTRHYSLGREVARRGADVTIVAAGFDHGSRGETRVHGRGLSRTERFGNVSFVWLRTPPYRANDWRRIANMVGYATLAPLALAGRPAPDVVIGSTVHPLAALAGWSVARLHGARFVYEIRDLWPQTLVDLGALGAASPAARALAAVEAFLVRRSELVVTVLPGARRYLAERGLPTAHVRYLPNGVDLAAFDAATRAAAVDDPGLPAVVGRLRRRRDGQVVFAYVGAHGTVNRLDVVLRGFKLATERLERPIDLLLVGDGPDKPRLRRLAAELDLSNVLFADPVPNAQVPAILAAVDVGVVHATATPVYRYGVSFNKVFDYMAARVPIVFACATANDPVAAAEAGCSVSPDDPETLAAAFVALASATPEERRRLGEAGRAFVEREHDVARLGERLSAMVGVGSARAAAREPRAVRSRPKRLLDVAGGSLALAVLGPAIATIGLAVRSTMGPPVLFRQRRPGYRGRPFELLKFRSMVDLADADGRPLPARRRFTRLGFLLRRWSLDELPELWNVVKGDMSLVGPRPLLMEYLPRYSAEQARRHEVKPGLTGLAQVNGRHLLDWDERFALDVWYVDHWSLWLDLRILVSTVVQVLRGRGLPPPTADDIVFRGASGSGTQVAAAEGAAAGVAGVGADR